MPLMIYIYAFHVTGLHLFVIMNLKGVFFYWEYYREIHDKW